MRIRFILLTGVFVLALAAGASSQNEGRWKNYKSRTLEFPTEMLFKEGSDEHWIAVQKPLLDYLPKEVKRGQAINAYVIWMGAIKVDNHWKWLFAMNEFDAP